MNSMPFRQLKSFLKILIGVQYELLLPDNDHAGREDPVWAFAGATLRLGPGLVPPGGPTQKKHGKMTRRILTGEETGPKRDVILMNAGMSLYLGIDGITLAEGIEKAKEMIDSGKAYAKLQEFVKATQEA